MFNVKAARKQRIKNFLEMLLSALIFDAIIIGTFLYAALT